MGLSSSSRKSHGAYTSLGMAKRTKKLNRMTGVRFHEEMEREIEDWRRAQPTIPAKGVAIRILVRAGLDAYKGKLPRDVKAVP